METEFNLRKLKQDTSKGTPRFHRFAYAEEDVKEFIRLLKEEIKVIRTGTNDDNRKYNINCGETLNMIDKLAGDKLNGN